MLSNQILSEQVDIYQLPTRIVSHAKNAKVTLGDLHGNAIKLLFWLIQQGVVSGITAKQYELLVILYRSRSLYLSRECLLVFEEILDAASIKPAVALRLLGDELADRGGNDYFTLKILEKLIGHGVSVEILLSNHGYEFVEAYETDNGFQSNRMPSHSIYSFFRKNLTNSMHAFSVLCDDKVISAQTIEQLINKTYKPILKFISYDLSDNGDAITLYSHARIDCATIKDVANKLKVPYRDESALALSQTIDAINIVFARAVQENKVHTLFDVDKIAESYSDLKRKTDYAEHPLERVIFNRRYDDLNCSPTSANGAYRIYYAHGHDSVGKELLQEAHIINLNESIGNNIRRHIGKLTSYYYADSPLFSERQQEEVQQTKELSPLLKAVETVETKQLQKMVSGKLYASDTSIGRYLLSLDKILALRKQLHETCREVLLDASLLAIIEKLTEDNLQRLERFIDILKKEQRFTASGLQQILNRMSVKLPCATLADQKTVESQPGFKQSDTELMLRDKRYGKTYLRIDEHEALRQIRYFHLVGQKTACAYKNSHGFFEQYLPPISGIPLRKVKVAYLPFKSRLSALISFLTDINLLHQHGHSHGRIDLDTVWLDTEKERMAAKDYRWAAKIGSPRMEDSLQGDMWNIATILSHLMACEKPTQESEDPFSYTGFVSLNQDTVETNSSRAAAMDPCDSLASALDITPNNTPKEVSFTEAESAAMQALTACIKDRERPCTSNRALHFCQAIAAEGEALTQEKVAHFVDTILKTPLDVDDLFQRDLVCFGR